MLAELYFIVALVYVTHLSMQDAPKKLLTINVNVIASVKMNM